MTPTLTLSMNQDGTITLPDGTVVKVANLPQVATKKASDPKRVEAAFRAAETRRQKANGTYVAPAKPEAAPGSEAEKRRAAAFKAWETTRARQAQGLPSIASTRGAVTSVDAQLAEIRGKASSWFGNPAETPSGDATVTPNASVEVQTDETIAEVPSDVPTADSDAIEASETPTLDAILSLV